MPLSSFYQAVQNEGRLQVRSRAYSQWQIFPLHNLLNLSYGLTGMGRRLQHAK